MSNLSETEKNEPAIEPIDPDVVWSAYLKAPDALRRVIGDYLWNGLTKDPFASFWRRRLKLQRELESMTPSERDDFLDENRSAPKTDFEAVIIDLAAQIYFAEESKGLRKIGEPLSPEENDVINRMRFDVEPVTDELKARMLKKKLLTSAFNNKDISLVRRLLNDTSVDVSAKLKKDDWRVVVPEYMANKDRFSPSEVIGQLRSSVYLSDLSIDERTALMAFDPQLASDLEQDVRITDANPGDIASFIVDYQGLLGSGASKWLMEQLGIDIQTLEKERTELFPKRTAPKLLYPSGEQRAFRTVEDGVSAAGSREVLGIKTAVRQALDGFFGVEFTDNKIAFGNTSRKFDANIDVIDLVGNNSDLIVMTDTDGQEFHLPRYAKVIVDLQTLTEPNYNTRAAGDVSQTIKMEFLYDYRTNEVVPVNAAVDRNPMEVFLPHDDSELMREPVYRENMEKLVNWPLLLREVALRKNEGIGAMHPSNAVEAAMVAGRQRENRAASAAAFARHVVFSPHSDVTRVLRHLYVFSTYMVSGVINGVRRLTGEPEQTKVSRDRERIYSDLAGQINNSLAVVAERKLNAEQVNFANTPQGREDLRARQQAQRDAARDVERLNSEQKKSEEELRMRKFLALEPQDEDVRTKLANYNFEILPNAAKKRDRLIGEAFKPWAKNANSYGKSYNSEWRIRDPETGFVYYLIDYGQSCDIYPAIGNDGLPARADKHGRMIQPVSEMSQADTVAESVKGVRFSADDDEIGLLPPSEATAAKAPMDDQNEAEQADHSFERITSMMADLMRHRAELGASENGVYVYPGTTIAGAVPAMVAQMDFTKKVASVGNDGVMRERTERVSGLEAATLKKLAKSEVCRFSQALLYGLRERGIDRGLGLAKQPEFLVDAIEVEQQKNKARRVEQLGLNAPLPGAPAAEADWDNDLHEISPG